MFLGFISVQLAMDGRIMPKQLAVPAVAAAIFIVLHIVMRIFVPSADGLLLPIAAALTFLGLVMIQRLDSKQALYQLIWIAVAAVCFILVIVFERNYESLAQYKYILGLTAIVLLMSTMFIGKEVNGPAVPNPRRHCKWWAPGLSGRPTTCSRPSTLCRRPAPGRRSPTARWWFPTPAW